MVSYCLYQLFCNAAVIFSIIALVYLAYNTAYHPFHIYIDMAQKLHFQCYRANISLCGHTEIFLLPAFFTFFLRVTLADVFYY